MEQRDYEKGKRRERLSRKKRKKHFKEEKEEFFEKCEFNSKSCIGCYHYSRCYDLEQAKDFNWEG